MDLCLCGVSVTIVCTDCSVSSSEVRKYTDETWIGKGGWVLTEDLSSQH